MVLMFVEPSAECEPQRLRDVLDHRVPARVAVMLGPEGGWAAAELESARAAGCLLVTLGPLTLRAESMPVAALAALLALS
jgi:16S rRNA (uracil1498-N3)-methyltransferase